MGTALLQPLQPVQIEKAVREDKGSTSCPSFEEGEKVAVQTSVPTAEAYIPVNMLQGLPVHEHFHPTI